MGGSSGPGGGGGVPLTGWGTIVIYMARGQEANSPAMFKPVLSSTEIVLPIMPNGSPVF